MGTVLHLLRSCIAGRGLWGKPFNGEIIPDRNTLVAALNSLKVRCSRVITASKPDGAPGITCHLHKLLPKKMHLSVPLLSAPLQLDASGYSWECHEDVVSHGRPSSHCLAGTRKIAQHCKATMFGHGRVCFLLILPRRNLFLMGTVLHLLRSCIAGRGLWGKPFSGETIPDGNTLVAALNSLKVRCSRVITASKPDGAPGITCHLHKLLPKKMH